MIAKTYAGTLGVLAFSTTVVRGLVAGAGLEGVMQSAIVALVLFAFLGMVIGGVAERIVQESVRATLVKEPVDSAHAENRDTST